MRRLIAMVLPSCLALIFCAGTTKADITGQIYATIPFQFHVANTTLPAGKYVLRMLGGSDLSIMTITSADNKITEEFFVRQAFATKKPQRSELVFSRYGQEEFLRRIFGEDSQNGEAVDETAREELRLQKKGVHPFVHSVEAALEKVEPK